MRLVNEYKKLVELTSQSYRDVSADELDQLEVRQQESVSNIAQRLYELDQIWEKSLAKQTGAESYELSLAQQTSHSLRERVEAGHRAMKVAIQRGWEPEIPAETARSTISGTIPGLSPAHAPFKPSRSERWKRGIRTWLQSL